MIVLKKTIRFICTLVLGAVLTSMLWCSTTVFASEGTVTIIDDAELLTAEQEASLASMMQQSTMYGNMVFYTTLDNPYSNVDFLGQMVYEELYSEATDGVIMVIDMDLREILLSGYGNCKHTLPSRDCTTITDNVYRDASRGDYYSCALTAFEQVHLVLNGKNIPRPMKYACNALLALALALLVNYFIAMGMSKKKAPSADMIRRFIHYKCDIIAPQVTFLREKRVYNPRSSSGGGGGGGGHSGGGGGHSSGSHKF